MRRREHLDEVEVPSEFHARLRNFFEVRMGVHLVAVRLRDNRVVTPVVVNNRPSFVGVATTARLAPLRPLLFRADEIVDIDDAHDFDFDVLRN